MLELLFWMYAAAAVAVGASSPSQAPTKSERACKVDADCVKTSLDCCGCSAGGTGTAVNKRSLAAFERRRGRRCGESVVCVAALSSDWSCTGTPVCSAGSCRIAWAVGGACERDDQCLSFDVQSVCLPRNLKCGPATCIAGGCSVVPQ